MMSNKQTNNFFEVDIKFALGYCPFFIMVGVDTGLPEQKKKLSQNTSSSTSLDPKFYGDWRLRKHYILILMP